MKYGITFAGPMIAFKLRYTMISSIDAANIAQVFKEALAVDYNPTNGSYTFTGAMNNRLYSEFKHMLNLATLDEEITRLEQKRRNMTCSDMQDF
jgi:hypothetical protein